MFNNDEPHYVCSPLVPHQARLGPGQDGVHAFVCRLLVVMFAVSAVSLWFGSAWVLKLSTKLSTKFTSNKIHIQYC